MFVRDQWTKAKSERKRLEEVLKRLKAEMQPLKDKHKEKEGQLNSSKQLQQVWVGKCMGSFRGELNSSKQLQQVWVGKCMGSFRGELNSSKQLQQVWVGKCMGSFRGELNSSKQLQGHSYPSVRKFLHVRLQFHPNLFYG